MFRCNLLLLLILATSITALGRSRGQPNRSVAQVTPDTPTIAGKVITIGYSSWIEKLSIDQGAVSDTSWATFSGTSLGIDFEKFRGRSSITTEVALLSGQATGGDSALFIPYVSPRISYWGIKAALKAERRQTAQIAFGAGVNVLYRQVKWKTDVVDMKVASGSDFNFAFLGEMKIRLNPRWEIRQELGAMAFNSSTYWMVGAGYRF